jgi:hypothetical protein
MDSGLCSEGKVTHIHPFPCNGPIRPRAPPAFYKFRTVMADVGCTVDRLVIGRTADRTVFPRHGPYYGVTRHGHALMDAYASDRRVSLHQRIRGAYVLWNGKERFTLRQWPKSQQYRDMTRKNTYKANALMLIVHAKTRRRSRIPSELWKVIAEDYLA